MLDIVGPVVRHRSDPGLPVPLATLFTLAIFAQGLPPGVAPGLEETA